MNNRIKKIIYNFAPVFNFIPFNNKFRLRGTSLKINKVILKNCKFDCKGKNNVIILNGNGTMRNCIFHIRGNYNYIKIDSDCTMNCAELWIEDDNNSILIGKNNKFSGKIHIACIEGTKIEIGDDCLFSSDIIFRTGDSHSILDNKGVRINHSKDIKIDNHVWIGNKVIINKGVFIAQNNMIGAGSLVTKKFNLTNTIIAGVPAKVIKEKINWCHERV